MSGWIKRSFAEDTFGPGEKSQALASAQVSPNRVVLVTSTGEAAHAGVIAPAFGERIGVSVSSDVTNSAEDFYVSFSGDTDVECLFPFAKGDPVKVYSAGKIGPVLTKRDAMSSRASSVGTAFANQPANDGIEIISDSALDVQYLDLYGTTNGGTTLVKERILLTGTSAVSTTKVNWGLLLGAIIPNGLGRSAVGTITIREASGNATITTITAGNRSSGVVTLTSANQPMFGLSPVVSASGASTKVVGIVATDIDTSTEVLAAKTLEGLNLLDFVATPSKVTYLLVGDVAGATTVTLTLSPFYDVEAVVGRALEAGVAGSLASIALDSKPAMKNDEEALSPLRVFDFTVTGAQIVGCATTPIQVLPPPPDGYCYFIEKIKTVFNYGSAAIVPGTMTTVELGHVYTGTLIAEIIGGADLGATSDFAQVLLGSLQYMWNEGLVISADADADSGGTGTTVQFTLWYRIVDIPESIGF